HVERRDADIRLIVRADDMLNPVRRAAELEPVKPIRLHAPSTQHEIQVAIAVEIHKCGQAVVARAAFTHRQITIDEMMLETKFSGRGCACEQEAQPGGLNQQERISVHGSARMNSARRTEKLSLPENTRCNVFPSVEIHFEGNEAES